MTSTRILKHVFGIFCVLYICIPCAAQTQFTELWESYTNGATPYGSWQLGSGTGFTWGSISASGLGGGKCYTVAAGQKSRIVRSVNMDAATHVVLHGWFYDSGGTNRSVLGLARLVGSNDNSMIRMGASGQSNYTIQYFDSFQSSSVITVDTGLPAEAGWHYMRLDIVSDGNPSNDWTVTWRIWNAAKTVEKIGTFGWRFDRVNCDLVTLGAATATTGAMSWDTIAVGSYADVGSAPSLPMQPWQVNKTVMASSQITGWEAVKAGDDNTSTVWSSVSHGADPNYVEWVIVDYGQPFLLNGARIHPRPGGACFPVDYRIEYSADFALWTTVPGMDFVNQTPPTDAVSLTFGVPVNARALRLRASKLSSDGYNHYLQIAELKPLGADPWAAPAELRNKKVINAAQYSTLNLYQEDAPTPAFLANNPDYLANHPFDGLSVPILLNRQWLTSQGLLEAEYALQDMVMTKLSIPWSQVSSAVEDLKRVNWGHVTDNFLWYRVSDSSVSGDNDTRYAVDPASSSDWAVVAQNAALCARVCREAGLKGFMMDTEMYTNYADGDLYPFGKGTPEVWRERGQQWIEAIQSEFPGITIIFFFSWGPESEPGGWPGYPNLKHFMNGVLAGVQSPARLIHGWETTFWWGGRAYRGGDMNDPNSYVHLPGDRAAYAGARNDIKNVWRNLSDNPTKYDQFVEAGMAAYVDSDPYNLWPGWPSGYLIDWPWSNLPYTLAYSDDYVWVWAAHTHYSASKDVLNPFMASIANRTFNTGHEEAVNLLEDFATDPLRRGWYFDFDMLSIGREKHGFPFLPVMNTDSVAYNWEPDEQAVRVKGSWTTGALGETTPPMRWQPRRYVHPVQPLIQTDRFQAEIDFKVESFGSDTTNPIVLGLFNSGELLSRQSATLQIKSANDARIVLVGNGTSWTIPLTVSGGLKTQTPYRVVFSIGGGTLRVALTDMSNSTLAAQALGSVPGSVGQYQFDQIGAALWDVDTTSTTSVQAYRYLMERARLYSGTYGGDIGGTVDWPDGLSVQLAGKQFYLDGGVFGYVQEPDRSSGMRVEGAISASVDHLVSVSGIMRTNPDGERYIELVSMEQGLPAIPEPLALVNRDLGGCTRGLQTGVWEYRYGAAEPLPATGLNNIGLLVTTTGKVTSKGADFFYVHDGSGIHDGDESAMGVRVAGVYAGEIGDSLIVTGASSLTTKSGKPVRVLLPRGPEDVRMP